MITPLKPSKCIPFFVVLDIENRSDGSVLCGELFDGRNAYVFSDWKQGWPLICSLAARDKRYRTIYAHNGGCWDWLSLLDYLRRFEACYNVVVSLSGSRVVSVTIEVGSESHRFSIRLLDSYLLLWESLDSAARTYIGKGKIDLEGVLPENLSQSQRLEYLHNDCVILHDTLQAFHQILNDIAPIGRLGITLASTALRIFRCGFLSKPISIPFDDELRSILRLAYKGGRVECFKPGMHDKVYEYDVNSLYPYIMRSILVPVSGHACKVTRRNSNRTGVYRVRARLHSQPLPIQDWNGEGWLFGPEVDYLSELVPVRILEGYEFAESDIIFERYIDCLYDLRLKYRNTALDRVAKLLMNSLYGKFGQKPERESVVWYSSTDELDRLIERFDSVSVLDEAKGIAIARTETECHYEHVGIAGYITSAARVYLHRYMDSNTIYCDTDSIHTSKQFPENLVGSALGQWKLSAEGIGLYAGRKLYCIHSNGKDKIRVKGVTVGGKFGASITFEDMKGIVYGKEREYRFYGSVTLRESITGKSPCRFIERKRTIKRST
jgi:hypothetical protein